MEILDWCIVGLMIGTICYLFKLEQRFSKEYESGGERFGKLRLNPDKLTENPFRELRRYIQESDYYSNLWRWVAIATSAICLILIGLAKVGLPDVSIFYIVPLLWLAVFAVIYNCLNFRQHHFHDWLHKTLGDTLEELSYTPGLKELLTNKLTQNPLTPPSHV